MKFNNFYPKLGMVVIKTTLEAVGSAITDKDHQSGIKIISHEIHAVHKDEDVYKVGDKVLKSSNANAILIEFIDNDTTHPMMIEKINNELNAVRKLHNSNIIITTPEVRPSLQQSISNVLNKVYTMTEYIICPTIDLLGIYD